MGSNTLEPKIKDRKKFDLDLKIEEIDNQLTNLKDMEDVFLDDLVLVETD